MTDTKHRAASLRQQSYLFHTPLQGRIQEFTKGEAVTAVDESQITVCEFYFIFL